MLYKLIRMELKDEQNHKLWLVYILRCSDGSFYTGATNCLEKRLACHHRGMASKYTRSRRPVSLFAVSSMMDKTDALRLEIKVKKSPKTKKVVCLKNGRPDIKTG